MASEKKECGFNQDDILAQEKCDASYVEDTRSSKCADEKGEGRAQGDYSGAVAKTDPREIALVRKLDTRMMPIIWAMYFLNYVDRNAIASARLNGLEDDLGLVGTQHNTCISILFVGYLLMQIPSNMLMSSGKLGHRVRLHLAHQKLRRPGNVRFFLGITEAPFYPGALFLLSLFYTRKEIALRISILYSGNIVATAMSGLIAVATFETLDGKHSLAGWQWLFIIEGVVTFCIAILGVFMLPDHPLTTKWLTPEERQLAHDRILADTVGSETSRGVLAGLKETCRDPRLYVLAFMQNMHLSAASFNNFYPTVISTLGFNDTISLVLTCPPYLVSGAVGVIVGITSGKWNERTWHITITMGLAVIAFIISCITLNTGARYFCCFVFTSGVYAVNSVILGWVSATLGQTPEKKAASLSVVNVVANASYIYTVYLYPESDGPRYLTALASNAAFGFATIASAWGLRWWLRSTNRKIQRGQLPGAEDGVLYAY
ncbi:putative MFS transporter [Aspergillus lucknowensis]|uniref:Major facilitator superfamily domain-containing protein n=1 Tax=Aspergillus lucknowensis TaxID=176173 RepID=A0ABR4LF34_9EURO